MRHDVPEKKVRRGNLMFISSLHTYVHMTYASIYKYVLAFHIYTLKYIGFVKVRVLENRAFCLVLFC